MVHLHHHHILYTNRENLSRRIIVHKDILTSQSLVVSDIAYHLLIGREKRSILLPVAHVIPANINRNHNDIFFLFKHTIINRDSWQRRPHFIDHSAFSSSPHSLANHLFFSSTFL